MASELKTTIAKPGETRSLELIERWDFPDQPKPGALEGNAWMTPSGEVENMSGESILTLDRVLALAKEVAARKSVSYVGAAYQMAEWLLTYEAELRASKRGGCQACSIEAEIGSEEDPHPVPARFHTCRPIPRCDECDPSFGCFDGSKPCSKKPQVEAHATEGNNWSEPKTFLQRAIDFLDGPGYDAQGSVGGKPGDTQAQRINTATEAAHILAAQFAEVALEARTQESKVRGFDFPCEKCGEFEGSALTSSVVFGTFWRCNNCGYPGK